MSGKNCRKSTAGLVFGLLNNINDMFYCPKISDRKKDFGEESSNFCVALWCKKSRTELCYPVLAIVLLSSEYIPRAQLRFKKVTPPKVSRVTGDR